jgi:hypothetical protein
MPQRSHWTTVALSVVLALLLPLAAIAQPDASPDKETPEIEGLGWYTSIDVAGADIESTYSAEEVEQWAVMLDAAGASFDDLEYTYQQVVDPATLPQLGGLATVRIDGAGEEAVLAAVLVDISAQAVSLGAEPTVSEPAIVGGKDVTKVDLPDELGPDDAYVYVLGDRAWVFVMQEALAELGLQGMP